MKRLAWVDVARGIGILGVVFGHAVGNVLHNALYAFHIPLFFLLSGFVYRASGTVKGYAVHRSRQLLVPYLFWLTLISIPGFLLAAKAHRLPRQVEYWAFGGYALGGQTGPMWFATVLLIALVAYDALRKLAPRWVVPVVVASYVLAMLRQTLLHGRYFPWDADVALYALPYLHLGAMAREGGWTERKAPLATLAALFVAYAALTQFGLQAPQPDLKQSDFGWPLVNVLLALGGAALIVLVSQNAGPLTKALAFVGKASLLLMFVHFAVLIGVERAGLHNPWLRFLVGAALPLALYPVFQRFRPTRIVLLGEVGSARPKSDEEPRLPESHTTAPAV